MIPRRRARWIIAGLIVLLALALLVLPWIGLEPLSVGRVLHDPTSQDAAIFWKLRLPRVLAGILAGSVLAVSGLAFQALFRNPLATPFTLGTASGASLGATLYIWTGWSLTLVGISGQTLFAFLGGLASLGLIYGFSRRRGGFPTETMLLAGVAIGFLFSSLILLLQYLSNQAHSLRILRWLMGGLEMTGFSPLLEALPFAALGLGAVFVLRMDLDLLSVGEDLAISRGMDIVRVKLILITAVGLMVGAIVAMAGPVGFIGIMMPHIGRLILGPDHRRLVLVSFLLGGLFLPLCDVFSRLLVAPAELPVGIITALLGGPFFIWLLLSQKHRAY